MWQKLLQLINNTEDDLKERMLRSIILVGELACIFASVEIFLVMDVSKTMLTIMMLMILFMIGIFFVTFKFKRYELAATLLGGVIIFFVMPPMFILSGGIEGGASVWLGLGVLYIFVMFNGLKMYLFLAACTVTYAGTFYFAYAYPQYIVEMPSIEIAHFDAWFSVLVVGTVGGGILKAHMSAFEKEHALNLKQKEELKNNQNARNVFFANMSHEIRTPINTIIGLNEMIMRESADEQTKEYAKDIQIASNMLLNQVNDILDFSQMEMEKMHIIPVKYKTKDLFGDLVELIRLRVERKNLKLHLDIDSNLPSVLLGDEKRLKQIFLNLLDNAVKYTQEGSITFGVQVEEYEHGKIYLKVTVADTGIGIRNEDLEHIYDCFARADEKRNRRITGTGLGLSITKELVTLMGGEINVDSIYTKGTIFTIILKQEIVENTPIGKNALLQMSKKTAETYEPTFKAPDAQILIVDDNAMNLMVTSKLLEGTGVQVDTASGGMECLKMTRKKFYHVILLDYMMPDLDGQQTMKEIRTQENGKCHASSVIALTGNVLSGAGKNYYEQGFDGYVEKPIESKLLEKEILEALPPEIVTYHAEEKVALKTESRIMEIMRNKRKRILVTSDCACDLSQDLLEEYGIEIMHLYVKTPYGRFKDVVEIDSDNLTQFISKDRSQAVPDSVTVEEYEEFFAKTLTIAEQVIHFAVSSRCGESYNVAVKAAKGFDHVRVIDSGQVSGGQGLLVMYAARMAKEGKRVEEICEEIEKVKSNIRLSFLMPSAYIFSQRGRAAALTAQACEKLQLHPMGEMKQQKAVLTMLWGGTLESTRQKAIRWCLRHKRKVNRDIVYIVHAGCNVKELEIIKEEVLQQVAFEKVEILKASFTTACNTGVGTIGIAFFENKR